MNTIKNTLRCLAMTSMLAALGSADEITARTSLHYVNSPSAPLPISSSQYAQLPAFDVGMGELTRVIVALRYKVRSDVNVVNDSAFAAQVSASVSDLIELRRADGALIIDEGSSNSSLSSVFASGESGLLRRAFNGTSSASMSTGFEHFIGSAEQVTIALPVEFNFSLNQLDSGLASTTYMGGARIEVTVTYEYTPTAGLAVLDVYSGSEHRATQRHQQLRLDVLEPSCRLV